MALVSLGYSRSDALRAVRSVSGADAMGEEALLKAALKEIIRF
jgi:Holliday junction resolvasome RuvABC DNA-binding subunit